ncbi:metal-binding protein [Paramagnetospirillum marisnigri]|uniref:Metal-binding protein n=1 Tax=Paramagnetospirillum marisnigri TaxID=1285242 RepID=A0A178MHU3_9PROT|nr:DUF411 domain-containing protein [Paramagnetospirillum marisnigri]OAN48133.1 metal-binding protein [Paramagnetospirillum marisnigri]
MKPLLAACALALLTAVPALAGDKDVTMWKSPSCGCCGGWAAHMEKNGYRVKSVDVDDIDRIKKGLGVPPALASCHTAKVGGYVVEGHVPAEAVDRLLKEKPKVGGLASPGMPSGSPGMEGPKEDNVVRVIGGANPGSVFATY